MQWKLQSRIVELERFIAQASNRDLPEQVQSYLFRFGAVLICGFIERSVEIIILERLSSRSHPRVLNFVKSHFKRGVNYDCEAIKQLLVRFDIQWHDNFGKFVEQNEDVVAGVQSVYAVRNSVAHGGSSSIGAKRLGELIEISKKLIEGLVVATA